MSPAFLDRTKPRKNRVPLSFYVLWHPLNADGEPLARELWRWLQGPFRDSPTPGQGIPVHFRSEPVRPGVCGAEIEGPGLRPIPLGDATVNVLVVLIDDAMVVDDEWRKRLVEIANAAGSPAAEERVLFYPVEQTSSFTQLPKQVTRFNPIRLVDWASSTDPSELDRHRRTQLRRLVTQAVVKALVGESKDPGAVIPRRVFLSHAKRDGHLGPGVAEHLRQVAAGYGQVEVFYDENDLSAGAPWEDPLLNNAAGGVGFIAVVSDSYAFRYWCRREVQLARTPRRLVSDEGPAIWTKVPSVVALALGGEWSRLPPGLTSIPARAWSPAHAAELLDEVFREALIQYYHVGCARILARLIRQEPDSLAFACFRLEASDLLHIVLETQVPERLTVIAPGAGAAPGELDGLLRRPDGELMSRSSSLRLTTFEEAWQQAYAPDGETGSAPWPPPEGATRPAAMMETPMVALSAGDSPDLAGLGYDSGVEKDGSKKGSLHLDVVVLRLAKALMAQGCRLRFGGELRRAYGFSAALLDAAVATTAASASRSTSTANSTSGTKRAAARSPSWTELDTVPLVVVDTHEGPRGLPSLADRAAIRGVAVYELADADKQLAELGVPRSDHYETARRAWSHRRGMRERLVNPRSAGPRSAGDQQRLVMLLLGGKVREFSGGLPGVAEELLLAHRESALDASTAPKDTSWVRAWVLGAYGGAAGRIAAYVLGVSIEYPGEFTPDWQRQRSSTVHVLCQDPAAAARVREEYDALRTLLDKLRAVARQPDETQMVGLRLRSGHAPTVGDWKQAMRADSPRALIRALACG